MRRSLFLSVSLLALSTSSVCATQEMIENLADGHTSERAVIARLQASQDYTFTLNEETLAESIKEAVVAFKQDNEPQQKISDDEKSTIKFNTQYRLRKNIDHLKDHPVEIGHGYFTARNLKGEFSTRSNRNPLVYPVFDHKGHRDAPDAFLPANYRGNFLSKELCDKIRYYAHYCNRNISEKEAQKLNKYLQPLFYITQLEVMKMLEGRDNIYHCRRWVYSKDRDGIIQAVKDQASHHHALIRKADLKYFDPVDVENRIVPQLVDLALSIIPTRLIEVHNDGRYSFRVGKSYKGALSLLHPLIDNLPYPILENDRLNGINVVSDMNIPIDYVADQAIKNQWARVEDFVNDDGRIAADEKRNMIKLFEPVGYLFRNAVRHLRVLADQYPGRDEAINRLNAFSLQYLTTHTIPEDVLNIFYHGRVDLHTLLQDVQVKSARHEGMVGDLIPEGLRDGLEPIRNNLLEALVFHDMVDRFKLFYPYHVHLLG